MINKTGQTGHDILAKPSTELITSIIGENNRGVAEFIAEHIVAYSVSEEWKIKLQRKEDRDRVDEHGILYGYSDKGCLQYPMINNISDDWGIILGT